MTRLETFRRANGIKPVRLARETHASRAYLVRVRYGRIEPTRPKMLAIRDACSRILGRRVYLSEVFDLGDTPAAVTRVQGNLFAEEWYRGTITDGCDIAGIMHWPDEDSDGATAAQIHYLDVMDEIGSRVYDSLRDAISEAFVRVATDVLTRENSR